MNENNKNGTAGDVVFQFFLLGTERLDSKISYTISLCYLTRNPNSPEFTVATYIQIIKWSDNGHFFCEVLGVSKKALLEVFDQSSHSYIFC